MPEIDGDAQPLIAMVFERLDIAHSHRDRQPRSKARARLSLAGPQPASLAQYGVNAFSE